MVVMLVFSFATLVCCEGITVVWMSQVTESGPPVQLLAPGIRASGVGGHLSMVDLRFGGRTKGRVEVTGVHRGVSPRHGVAAPSHSTSTRRELVEGGEVGKTGGRDVGWGRVERRGHGGLHGGGAGRGTTEIMRRKIRSKRHVVVE